MVEPSRFDALLVELDPRTAHRGRWIDDTLAADALERLTAALPHASA